MTSFRKMRQAHFRLLAARGLELGQKQQFKQLVVFEAIDSVGQNVLAIRASVLGTSWPSIAWVLSEADIEIKLLDAGPIWVIAADNAMVREVLEKLSALAKASSRDLVLVPEVGFVNSGVGKKFEPRVLIGPALGLIAVIGLSFWTVSSAADQEVLVAETSPISCALDLENRELEKWLVSTIGTNPINSSGSVVAQEELGLLNLEVGQVLGSTQEISGYLECRDGRKKSLHYRLDVSASGNLVPLGPKLDP